MNIRDKKTGKIVKLEKILFKNVQTEDLLKWNTYEPNVNSLAELNEEWEDYKPTEPIIEVKKARKVFREWADLIGAEQFRVTHFFNSKRHMTLLRSTDLTTEPSIELPDHIGKDSETYTKIELVGEEEEC